VTFASPYSSLRFVPALRRSRLEAAARDSSRARKSFDTHARNQPRRACVHLSFWTNFRSQPKPPRPFRTLRCAPPASSPALGSLCISRRSRSAGTSVLTLAHVFVGFACAIHVHAPVQSHLSMTSIFRWVHLSASVTFECRDLPAPAPRDDPPPFEQRSSRDVEHRIEDPRNFSAPQTSRDAA
jgi:hypothetical protein